MKPNGNMLINLIQWVLIVVLAVSCIYMWTNGSHDNKLITEEIQFQKNDKQFVAITNDKTLRDLKKTNKVLYDSIVKLTNVKQATQIKYIIKYKTDTIRVSNVKPDSDSVFHYENNSDTINYKLSIKARDVEWYKLNLSIHDSLMLVTRSLNGQNETTVSHSSFNAIKDVSVFTPKIKMRDKLLGKFYLGLGVGYGYGVFTHKPDVFVGVNAGFRL